ncbi:hypothetical protein Tco_0578424 [Tanacetum coccineum]
MGGGVEQWRVSRVEELSTGRWSRAVVGKLSSVKTPQALVKVSSNDKISTVPSTPPRMRQVRESRHMLFVHEEEVNEKSSLDDYHIKMGSTLFFVTLIKPMQQLKFGRREFFVFKTISRDSSYLLIANSAKVSS